MSAAFWLVPLLVLGATLAGTAVVRQFALKARLLDEPNARSSHSVPTPRGGGLAIVLTCLLAWMLVYVIGVMETRHFLTLSVGGAAVALAGFLDDRQGVDARIRLAVHLIAAVLAVALLGAALGLGWIGFAVTVLGIGWFLNLFNFMDGIDGIAASEAAFIALAGAALHLLAGGYAGIAIAALTVGAAALGFLFWNWPPAKIFLGDVGSGFLGYALAVLAISSARGDAAALFPWLILSAVFLADSGVTLMHRVLRGQIVHEAHRTHAYQWLSRKWQSHRRVTLLVTVINVAWLLPLAWWACMRPLIAGRIFVLAIVPIAIAAMLVGAGRQERRASRSA